MLWDIANGEHVRSLIGRDGLFWIFSMEALPRIKLFRNIDNLILKLSDNEIHNFRPWRFDGYRWISFSDYYYFGDQPQKNILQNNIACYISSSVETYAQDLKLILNIYHHAEKLNAVNTFTRLALKTFSILDLIPPQNLLTSIATGVEHEYENDIHFTRIKVVEAHVPSWRVVIESK